MVGVISINLLVTLKKIWVSQGWSEIAAVGELETAVQMLGFIIWHLISEFYSLYVGDFVRMWCVPFWWSLPIASACKESEQLLSCITV